MRRKRHTLRSIVVEMEMAVKDVEREVGELEVEAERALEGIKETVGEVGEMQQRGRSDNSHGRIPMVDEGLRDLRRLEKTCNGMNIENGSSSN